MATRILLVSLFLSLLVACDKKEDVINPGQDYSGNLTLTYSRTFPTFDALAGMNVNISKSGDVTLSTPQPVGFDATSEKMIDGLRTRVREYGVITIHAATGSCVNLEGRQYVDIVLTCSLEGWRQLCTCSNGNWSAAPETPLTGDHPVSSPMRFSLGNAVMDEAVCGGTCSDALGNTCFMWRLKLTPAG